MAGSPSRGAVRRGDGGRRAAARSPGPLRAFYQRLAARRGRHIAAVATARKLAMIAWHMLTREADYIWARPMLLTRKFRAIELRAGLPTEHSKRGDIPEKRAEQHSARFTSRWRTRRPGSPAMKIKPSV